MKAKSSKHAKASSKRKPSVEVIDPSQYKGLIVTCAVRCYNGLPPFMKNFVGIEDLVQEGLMHAFNVLNPTGKRSSACPQGRKAKFDVSRSAMSSFVHVAVERMYMGLAAKLRTKKRYAEMCSLEDNHAAISRHFVTSGYTEYLDAYAKAQRLHKQASIELVEFLDENLFHTPDEIRKPRGKEFKRLTDEFQALVKRTGLTLPEYRAVVAATRKTVPLS